MFETREVALEFARVVKGPIDVIREQKAGLADQIERAVMSVVLNIGEASRRIGKDRQNRWRYASGSGQEARDGLRLAIAWGYVPEAALEEALALLDRVLAMLWVLEHPRRRDDLNRISDAVSVASP